MLNRDFVRFGQIFWNNATCKIISKLDFIYSYKKASALKNIQCNINISAVNCSQLFPKCNVQFFDLIIVQNIAFR